jgi:nitrate reductase NapAB chaperone NapD
MYKQFFFLHKTKDDKALAHFKEAILTHLSEISRKEIRLAKVESNLLLDQKYSYCCEIEFESKDKMDVLMDSKAGKQLTKDLMDYHQLVTVISINYSN